MTVADQQNDIMFRYIYRPGENKEADMVIKSIYEYIGRNRRSFYFHLYRGYLKDVEGIGLEYSEKSYDFQKFPKVMKLRNLRIPTGDLHSFEGACRCSFGMAYHMLGYSKGDMEMEPSCYIDLLLDNPKINTVARACLLKLAEEGYFENMHCISAEAVNAVLKDIGLAVAE